MTQHVLNTFLLVLNFINIHVDIVRWGVRWPLPDPTPTYIRGQYMGRSEAEKRTHTHKNLLFSPIFFTFHSIYTCVVFLSCKHYDADTLCSQVSSSKICIQTQWMWIMWVGKPWSWRNIRTHILNKYSTNKMYLSCIHGFQNASNMVKLSHLLITYCPIFWLEYFPKPASIF